MNTCQLFRRLLKLLVCGLAFLPGMIVGAIAAGLLGLPQPAMQQSVDNSTSIIYMVAVTPILALALALVSRGLAGGFWVRAAMLSFYMPLIVRVPHSLEIFADSLVYAGGLVLLLRRRLVWISPSGLQPRMAG